MKKTLFPLFLISGMLLALDVSLHAQVPPLLAAPSTPGAPRAPKLDQKAQDLLTAFGKYYAALPSFQVDVRAAMKFEMADAKDEAVRDKSRANGIENAVSVAVLRPDRFAIVQKEGSGGFLSFDGKTCTVYLANQKEYVSVPAISLLFPEGSASFSGAPFLFNAGLLRDLFAPDPVNILLRGVTSGSDVGEEKVGALTARHLVLQGNQMTVDLWISSGKNPLLLRSRVSRDMSSAVRPPAPAPVPGAPAPTPVPRIGKTTFEVFYENWRVDQPAPAEAFDLKVPADAKLVTGFHSHHSAMAATTGAPLLQHP